jgi:hypothetical protein
VDDTVTALSQSPSHHPDPSRPGMSSLTLGLGDVPGEGPVDGQLSGTLRAWLTHLTLRVPVLGSRGLSPSRSPALQLGPQGSLW